MPTPATPWLPKPPTPQSYAGWAETLTECLSSGPSRKFHGRLAGPRRRSRRPPPYQGAHPACVVFLASDAHGSPIRHCYLRDGPLVMRELGPEDAADAIWGGSVLACGGGGWVAHGEMMGELATRIGTPRLATVDEVDDDAIVATVTAIGAPAALSWEMRPLDYVRALRLLEERAGRPVAAVMTAQNGSSTTLNGWIQSAVTGVLVLDAAGDIRAHPTGKLGALGLTTRAGYETIQVVAGGNRARHGNLEVVATGSVITTANVLRDACARAGGFIASARHPVEAAWVKRHAAVGAVSYALRLGATMRAAAASGEGGDGVIEALCTFMAGSVVVRGPVHIPNPLRTEGGFDHGHFEVAGLRLPFLNEYMALEAANADGGERIATYPDVITTLSTNTGRPVSIADMREGEEVAVLVVDRSKLILSTSCLDRVALAEVEEIMDLDLLTYVPEAFNP